MIWLLLLLLAAPAWGLDVIPGLKGFGTDTRAAYGGTGDPEICVVDSLDVTTGATSSDAVTYSPLTVRRGTFAQCAAYTPAGSAGKIILFEVSGMIGDASMRVIYMGTPFTTIAGQSAPSPGVGFKNYSLTITTHDVLVQHLRWRHVSEPSGYDPLSIATISGDVYNVVADHVSVAWGGDETVLILETGGYQTYDVTLSNSFVGEGIKGAVENGHNILVSRNTTNVALIGNLSMSSTQRMPWMENTSGVVVNNLIYNGAEQTIKLDPVYTTGTFSVVGNVTKGGPNSIDRSENKIVNIFNKVGETWPNGGAGSSVYLSDNACDAGAQASASDWSLVYDPTGIGSVLKVTSAPIWPTGLTALDWEDVESTVLTQAGAWAVARDSVDERFADEVLNRTGYVKTSVPVYPTLAENSHTLSIPANPHTDAGSGYTNLEVWLQELADVAQDTTIPPDTTPPVMGGGSPTRAYSGTRTLSWTTDEDATCEYGTAGTFSYGAGSTPDTTGETAHSVSVALTAGDYEVCTQCEDGSSNTTTTAYCWDLSVTDAPAVGAANDTASGTADSY